MILTYVITFQNSRPQYGNYPTCSYLTVYNCSNLVHTVTGSPGYQLMLQAIHIEHCNHKDHEQLCSNKNHSILSRTLVFVS